MALGGFGLAVVSGLAIAHFGFGVVMRDKYGDVRDGWDFIWPLAYLGVISGIVALRGLVLLRRRNP